MSENNGQPDSPAMKSDLLALEERMTLQLSALEERMTESARAMQTEVISAFYGFTRTMNERLQSLDHTDTDIKGRLTVVEDRLTEIERRLILPPRAA